MNGKLKSAVAATVYVAVAALCFPLRGAMSPEKIYETVLPSTVTLDVENAAGQHFVGSAFLAVGEGLAVTAWHVVHDARRVEACFADHRRVAVAGLVDRNEELDLALIKLETGSPSPNHSESEDSAHWLAHLRGGRPKGPRFQHQRGAHQPDSECG